jgi:uncharacterized protein YdhG (YjbR/CyaY superfamily)
MPAKKKPTKKTAKRTTSKKTFTTEERSAMKTRARELAGGDADDEKAALAAIAELAAPDRTLAKRLHALVKANAPMLAAKTWYGMPAYAKDGKVVCFFQAAAKFKARYATFGFNDAAQLDDGAMWPTAFALTKLGDAEEKTIAALLKRAVR